MARGCGRFIRKTYQRAILGRLGGRERDDLCGLCRDAEPAPCVHHGFALLQGVGAPVGGFRLAFESVRNGKFGKLTGNFVLSPTQSRNVLRMPWTEMAGLMRWQARRNAFSESGRPALHDACP